MSLFKNLSALYVDPESAESPATREVLQNLANPPDTRVRNLEELFRIVREDDDPETRGKKVLALMPNRGRFLRDCPGTREYTCCGYTILHVGAFCPMDCAYCVLQAYFHPPVLTFFTNHERMFEELEAFFRERPPDRRRVGTGEFTDSLVWEEVSTLNHRLVEAFGVQDHAVLELKSKSVLVDALAGLDHNRKTIVAFSLNTERVIRHEERKTSGLSARLDAAARCVSWGYPVAFHFDPIVPYAGCEEEYAEVIFRLFRTIPPEAVVWMSLGVFRFMPALKEIVARRFPDSRMIYEEYIPGLDGKMRLFRPLRIRLYQEVYRALREAAPGVTAYFCMEHDPVWREVFGFLPKEKGGLPAMLDRSAQRVCGIR